MPGRTIGADPDDWRRLGEAVARRRDELQLTQAEAVARSGDDISLAVWSILENANQRNGRMAARSLRGASRALGWPEQRLEAMLAGGGELGDDVDLDLNSAAADLSPASRRAVLDFIAAERRRAH